MKEVWVVWCKIEGCHNCSVTCNILGVFDNSDDAAQAERDHRKIEDPHWHNTDITRIEMNLAVHFLDSKKQFVR